MRSRPLLAVAVSLALALALTTTLVSCGDGDGSGGFDPAQASAQLQEGGLPKPEADCIAGALDKAGLTLADYRQFSKGRGPNLQDPKMQTYGKQVTQCFADLPNPTGD